jgi:hypothetical protein
MYERSFINNELIKMVATPAKKPSFNPKGRPTGSRNKMTKGIKESIEKAFHKAERKGFLDKLAISDPATFCGLVRAIIPAELQANVNHNVSLQINIGEAMQIAGARLAQQHDNNVIDVLPVVQPPSELIPVKRENMNKKGNQS